MKSNFLIHLLILLSIKHLFAQEYGGWITTDSMKVSRGSFATVVLPDSNILASGGEKDSILNSAEIYNGNNGKWHLTDPMKSNRINHHLVLLKNGKALAIGGLKNRSCELFDPITQTWEFTDSLNFNRNYGMTCTVLENGSVLITGGSDYNPDGSQIILNTCEIFDPEYSKWEIVASMNHGRRMHQAVLLNNHNVLVIGGSGASKQCEIYNVFRNEWVTTGSLNIGRADFSATKIPDGKVLVFGGTDNSCEIYDPNTNHWTMAGSMANSRSNHHSILLDNGLILIFGGLNITWEMYDSETLKSIHIADFPVKKMYQNANVLPDGRIMSIGGFSWKGDLLMFDVPWCEIYDPNLLKIIKTIQPIPYNFQLKQNYPNPFNNITTIEFYLPKGGLTTIEVYNVQGEKVITLMNTVLSSGGYLVQLSGYNLASGIYICVLKLGDLKLVQKMVLVR